MIWLGLWGTIDQFLKIPSNDAYTIMIISKRYVGTKWFNVIYRSIAHRKLNKTIYQQSSFLQTQKFSWKYRKQPRFHQTNRGCSQCDRGVPENAAVDRGFPSPRLFYTAVSLHYMAVKSTATKRVFWSHNDLVVNLGLHKFFFQWFTKP